MCTVPTGKYDGQRALENVKRMLGVANIDDLRFGNDIQDYSLYSSDEVIVDPEIGSKRDDGTMRQRSSQ
jgi:hypothetical protein